MTLDMYGNPIVPYYFKLAIVMGIVGGVYKIYLFLTDPRLYESVQRIIPMSDNFIPISELIPTIMNSIPLIILWIIVSIIILFLYEKFNKLELPREDEVH